VRERDGISVDQPGRPRAMYSGALAPRGDVIKFRRRFIGGIVLLCSLGMATSIWARDLHAHAAVGRTVRVWGSVNFSEHCSSVVETMITVTQSPAYGSVSIRDEIVKQNSPDSGSCGRQSGMGKVVYYTRTSPGIDHFKYTSSSSAGAVDHDVTID
jgi:hypothetical protein